MPAGGEVEAPAPELVADREGGRRRCRGAADEGPRGAAGLLQSTNRRTDDTSRRIDEMNRRLERIETRINETNRDVGEPRDRTRRIKGVLAAFLNARSTADAA